MTTLQPLVDLPIRIPRDTFDSKLFQAALEPHRTTAQALQAALEPHRTTAQALQAALEPHRTTAQALQAALEPHRTTAQALQAALEPHRTTAQALQAALEPHRTTLRSARLSQPSQYADVLWHTPVIENQFALVDDAFNEVLLNDPNNEFEETTVFPCDTTVPLLFWPDSTDAQRVKLVLLSASSLVLLQAFAPATPIVLKEFWFAMTLLGALVAKYPGINGLLFTATLVTWILGSR